MKSPMARKHPSFKHPMIPTSTTAHQGRLGPRMPAELTQIIGVARQHGYSSCVGARGSSGHSAGFARNP